MAERISTTPDPQDPSIRLGIIAGFTSVIVELDDGNTVELSAEKFSDNDRSNLAVGSLVRILGDGRTELPAPDYATDAELREEEIRAAEFISRALNPPHNPTPI